MDEDEKVEEENQKDSDKKKEVHSLEVIDERLSKEKLAFTRLRILLRTITTRLCKHFKRFFKPIDVNSVLQTDLSLQDIRDFSE
eukprot:UN20363